MPLGQAVKGGLEFGLGQLQRRQIGRIQAIKAGGVLQHGGIAALLHIGQDGGHALFNGRVLLHRPVQTLRKILLKST